jgi:hypothetical protein
MADSLIIAAAGVLFAASVAAWTMAAPLRAAARLYLRFAAVLFAALAVCAPLHLADVASLFLLPLGAASLMLAALGRFARPANTFAASAILLVALAGGLGALVSGVVLVSLLPVMLACLAIVAAALNAMAVTAALSGIALLAGSLAVIGQGAGTGLLLLGAAAVLGLAAPRAARKSALAVDQQGLARGDTGIGRPRHAHGGLGLRHHLAQDLRDK